MAALNRRAAAAVMWVVLAASVGACARTATDPGSAALPPSSSTAPASTAPAAPAPAPAHDAQGWQDAGTSVQGRALRVRTLGTGPRRVVFVGGIHGDEAEGAYSTAELPGAFTAARLADAVTLTVLEDANPDGRVAATRTNAAGVDLNRNFPAKNFDPANPAGGRTPLNQPESKAVAALIDRVRPDLVMVMHSWHDREFINFDGPAQALAQRFSAASRIPVTASSEFAATPGSLGSWAGRDRGIAVLTIELRKGSDPAADWERIRAAVLAAIAGR